MVTLKWNHGTGATTTTIIKLTRNKWRENVLKEMEKLQSVKVRALDTKATLENLNLKGKIHNVQNDLSFG